MADRCEQCGFALMIGEGRDLPICRLCAERLLADEERDMFRLADIISGVEAAWPEFRRLVMGETP